MKIRFLQVTSSAIPGYPYQAGQVIDVQNVPPDLPTWITAGHAELVQDDEPELAAVAQGERAVPKRGSRRG